MLMHPSDLVTPYHWAEILSPFDSSCSWPWSLTWPAMTSRQTAPSSACAFSRQDSSYCSIYCSTFPSSLEWGVVKPELVSAAPAAGLSCAQEPPFPAVTSSRCSCPLLAPERSWPRRSGSRHLPYPVLQPDGDSRPDTPTLPTHLRNTCHLSESCIARHHTGQSIGHRSCGRGERVDPVKRRVHPRLLRRCKLLQNADHEAPSRGVTFSAYPR